MCREIHSPPSEMNRLHWWVISFAIYLKTNIWIIVCAVILWLITISKGFQVPRIQMALVYNFWQFIASFVQEHHVSNTSMRIGCQIQVQEILPYRMSKFWCPAHTDTDTWTVFGVWHILKSQLAIDVNAGIVLASDFHSFFQLRAAFALLANLFESMVDVHRRCRVVISRWAHEFKRRENKGMKVSHAMRLRYDAGLAWAASTHRVLNFIVCVSCMCLLRRSAVFSFDIEKWQTDAIIFRIIFFRRIKFNSCCSATFGFVFVPRLVLRSRRDTSKSHAQKWRHQSWALAIYIHPRDQIWCHVCQEQRSHWVNKHWWVLCERENKVRVIRSVHLPNNLYNFIEENCILSPEVTDR